MMFTKPVIVACLAAITQAFLLPPSIESADIDIIKTLPIESAAQAESQTVNLQCTSCPLLVVEKSGKAAWVQGSASHLPLDFTVSHKDVDVLLINGVQVYPHSFERRSESLTAVQVAEGSSPSDTSNQHLRLGYELSFHPLTKHEVNGDANEIQLIAVKFQVIEIGDQFVDGLDVVELKLLKTPSGKLMIASAETSPTTNAAIGSGNGGADCTTLVCKLKAILAGQRPHTKPKKGCGSKAGPHSSIPGGRPHRHHGRPHPYHHGHRHRHHGFTHFLHAMRSIALHVLIPIFIGIAVGITASIVGMIAGQMIVFFWRAIYRSGEARYSQVDQDVANDEVSEEEKSFLEHQGPPPVYDETTKDEKTSQ